MVENERNLLYTASDRRLNLAREPNSCRQLSLKLFNGYLVKDDIASGGYSVVLIILNVPIFSGGILYVSKFRIPLICIFKGTL